MYKPSKKKRSKNGIPNTGGRKHIKFGGDLSSDSSESESEIDKVRPWLKQRPSLTASSSSPTLVNGRESPKIDYDLELAKLKKGRIKARGDMEVLDYSDFEEDLGSPRGPSQEPERSGVAWSPGFMKRYPTGSASTGGGLNGSRTGSNPNVALPLGAVPATPSLIKALDRISAAQQDAFGVAARSASPLQMHTPLRGSPAVSVMKGKQKLDGMPQDGEMDGSDDEEARGKERERRAPRWEEFWRDVKAKADS